MVILDFSTLSGTNLQILIPKRYDPPPPPPLSAEHRKQARWTACLLVVLYLVQYSF